MRNLLASIVVAAVLFLSTGADSPAAERVLRLGTDHVGDYVTTKALRRFAERVKEYTDGSLVIDVYDGGQLGMERACIEQAQFGALDIAKASSVIYSDFVPEFGVLTLPYLFRDIDHMWKVLKSDAGRDLLTAGESAQLIGICWLDAGSRCFYGKKPIKTRADLENLKIRVPESHMMVAMVEALGSLATPMPSNDIYSALQTGVCDAAENVIPRYLDMSHQEVAPHLIVDRHNFTPDLIIFNRPTWNSLTPDQQEAVLKAAATIEDELIVETAAEENRVLKILEEKGVSIVYPDASVITSFRDACQSVYDKFGATFAEFLKQTESM